MKKIGDLLKTEREKQKLSLHEIGMALKINPKILKAIEDADAENLPAKTFLRGFIRSYCQYLHLDVDQFMKLFQEELGSTRPEDLRRVSPDSKIALIEKPVSASKTVPQNKPVAAAKETTTNKPEKTPVQTSGEGLSAQKIYTIAGSLILVLLIIFVSRMVDKYQKESHVTKIQTAIPIATDEKEAALKPLDPSDPITAADAPVPPMTPISGEAVVEAKPPTKPVATLVNNKPEVAATQAATPTPTGTPKPTPAPTPAPNSTITKAIPTPSTPSLVKPPLASTPIATTEPAANAATPDLSQKPAEVIIEALNNVQVRYSFGGDKWENINLMADEFHTFKSRSGVLLEINDGGAVSLIVNGRDRGVPGSIGKPIKLSFPK